MVCSFLFCLVFFNFYWVVQVVQELTVTVVVLSCVFVFLFFAMMVETKGTEHGS
jgi:hypothetical protein